MKKPGLFRNIAKGFSLTSALFIFQACYGTGGDFQHDILVEGQVKSADTKLPIKGIQVSSSYNGQTQLTDENGNFSMYVLSDYSSELVFKDIDGAKDGEFEEFTYFLNSPDHYASIEVFLNAK